MAVRLETVKIANGASDSDVINVSDQVICGIFVPNGFTPVGLTFLGSVNNVDPSGIGGAAASFVGAYDAQGNPLVITSAQNRLIIISAVATRPLRFAKLRSCDAAGAAVTVGADFLFGVVLDDHGGA